MSKMSLGTLINTWLSGKFVGVDDYGNRYYKSNRGRLNGRERRWCLFRGAAEPSRVPPDWHAWLHHTVVEPLTHVATEWPHWQKQHSPNLTGTAMAYRPAGHAYKGGRRAAATGDYQAWSPE